MMSCPRNGVPMLINVSRLVRLCLPKDARCAYLALIGSGRVGREYSMEYSAPHAATSEALFFLKDFSGGGCEARATAMRNALHKEERIVVYDSHISRDPQGAPQGGVFASFRHLTVVPANKQLDVMKLCERYIILKRNLHTIGPIKGFFPLNVAFSIGPMATIDLALLHLAKVEKKTTAPHLVYYDDLFQYCGQGVPDNIACHSTIPTPRTPTELKCGPPPTAMTT